MIKEFEQAVKKMVPIAVDAAKVIKVDGDTCEVESLTGKEDFFKCSLNAVRENGENKVLLTPKIGSTVIIGILEGRHKQDAVVLQVCDLKKVYLNMGGTVIELDSADGKMLVKNGEVSLLSLMTDLADLLKQLKVSTPNGPSGTPLPPSIQAITKFETDLGEILK